MKYLTVLFSLILLPGCSASFLKQKFEEECFDGFTTAPHDFFSFLEDPVNTHIWRINGSNNGDDFLLESQILGYVLPDGSRSFYEEKVDDYSKMLFTGRVLKIWPSWGQYYIGGGRKNVQIEVIISGRKYLIFENYIPSELKKKINGRCLF